jgi:hypothetical protein
MLPGYVKDDSEYRISKNLLIKFICSAPVLAAAEGDQFMIVAILKFLRGHMFTWETLYLHYLQKSITHFNTSHLSVHEGTNH